MLWLFIIVLCFLRFYWINLQLILEIHSSHCLKVHVTEVFLFWYHPIVLLLYAIVEVFYKNQLVEIKYFHFLGF